MNYFSNKKILITGVCGTVGSALAKHILSKDFADNISFIGIDNNESEIFNLSVKYAGLDNAKFVMADIRDHLLLKDLFHGVDLVIHAAALKHVAVCEESYYQMINTNILGLHNVVEAARSAEVSKVIFTSSDKAVNPSSNMGASKLIGEGIFRSLNDGNNHSQTIFATTRFGNVLGSRGSVLPIFYEQIKNDLNLTITHSDMTRFIMGIDDAVMLVLRSAALARGGEIFVTKMPAIRIEDLAKGLLKNFKKEKKLMITEIGIKRGEKLYEELIAEFELHRTIEVEDFFIIFNNAAFKESSTNLYGKVKSLEIHDSYNSSSGQWLSKDEILNFLKIKGLLPTSL